MKTFRKTFNILPDNSIHNRVNHYLLLSLPVLDRKKINVPETWCIHICVFDQRQALGSIKEQKSFHFLESAGIGIKSFLEWSSCFIRESQIIISTVNRGFCGSCEEDKFVKKRLINITCIHIKNIYFDLVENFCWLGRLRALHSLCYVILQ